MNDVLTQTLECTNSGLSVKKLYDEGHPMGEGADNKGNLICDMLSLKWKSGERNKLLSKIVNSELILHCPFLNIFRSESSSRTRKIE